MKKITKLIQEFIDGTDMGERKKDLLMAIELGNDLSINSIMVYDYKQSDIDSGLSYKNKEGNSCKIFEIIWQDDNFEFWFESSQLEMKLNPDRLELMARIIHEMNRYNNEVLPWEENINDI